jgi:hypothetical protein
LQSPFAKAEEMKRFVSSLALILLLASCGGSDSGGDSLPGSTQDRSRGDQRLSAGAIETTDSFSFDTRIVPGSVVQQKSLHFSGTLKNVAAKTYLVSNLDGLKQFNRILSDNQRVSFDDLSTRTYFLIPASDCPAYSELAGIDYGLGQVTIKVDRYKPKEDGTCMAADTLGFHVFKGEKSQAPEILFESLELQAQSHIDDERLEIVSDAAAWAALWAEHHRGSGTPPALPNIDFSQKMIVGVYIGVRPNGCYNVGIDRIYQSGQKNIVEYTEQIPSEEDICTLALVSPSHLVIIPKTPYPFEFRKSVRSR